MDFLLVAILSRAILLVLGSDRFGSEVSAAVGVAAVIAVALPTLLARLLLRFAEEDRHGGDC